MAHFDTRAVDGFKAMGDVKNVTAHSFGANVPDGTMEVFMILKNDGGKLRTEYAAERAVVLKNLRDGIKILYQPDGTIQGIHEGGVVFVTKPNDNSPAGVEKALNQIFDDLADGALAGMIAMHGGIKFVRV